MDSEDSLVLGSAEVFEVRVREEVESVRFIDDML